MTKRLLKSMNSPTESDKLQRPNRMIFQLSESTSFLAAETHVAVIELEELPAAETG